MLPGGFRKDFTKEILLEMDLEGTCRKRETYGPTVLKKYLTSLWWAAIFNLSNILYFSLSHPYINKNEGNGNPLQYSCLENFMDREVWWATVHGVANSWT